MEFKDKAPIFLKGVNFTLLAVSGILMILGLANNPVVTLPNAALMAGVILIVNSVVEGIELIMVDPPDDHERLFTAYKVLSLMASIIAAILLLTSFARDPIVAMWIAVILLFIGAAFDVAEAVVLK